MLRHETERIKENKRLIREHLVKLHKDKDEDSLYVRFNQILRYLEEVQIEMEVNWNHLLKVLDKE